MPSDKLTELINHTSVSLITAWHEQYSELHVRLCSSAAFSFIFMDLVL